MATVSDSSPLIALEQIGHLELLRDLFQEVLVPDEVVRETTAAVGLRRWLRRQPLQGPLLSQVLRPTLGQGEREAISMAVELRAHVILLDDEAARNVAIRLGLPVMGTAGVLLIAKERGLIAQVKPHLDALLANRFFLGAQVYELVLSKAGEL